MDLLEALELKSAEDGYEFLLDGEVVGRCVLLGDRLLSFEIDRDQRRCGIGSRAMELLLATLNPDSRLEIEIPATDPVGRAFLEARGFGIKGLVFDRRVVASEESIELFRPVGQKELELIQASGMRAFPPRLPEQPIFYPVATLEYARLIASDWNVRDEASGNVGYVLRFRVLKDYLDRHPPQEAGGRDLVEHWIPAEDMPAFNAALVGEIELVEKFS